MNNTSFIDFFENNPGKDAREVEVYYRVAHLLVDKLC